MFATLTNSVTTHALVAVAFFLAGWWAKKTYGDTKTAETAALDAANKVVAEAEKATEKATEK